MCLYLILLVDDFSEFPYRGLRYLGVAILMVALIVLLVGVADLAYTLVLYQFECDPPADWIGDNPCQHEVLIWTWISSGVWVGLIVSIIHVFFCCVILTGDKITHTHWHKKKWERISDRLLSPGWQPALLLSWCRIWWFSSVKELVIHVTE